MGDVAHVGAHAHTQVNVCPLHPFVSLCLCMYVCYACVGCMHVCMLSVLPFSLLFFLEDFILSLVINKAKWRHKPKWGNSYYRGGKSHLGGVNSI
jgi:hypothetical protein